MEAIDKSVWILCPNALKLPTYRDEILDKAFGKYSDLPISYIQGEYDLNRTSFMDLKIDKWVISPKWNELQEDEPMIHIEFLRGKKLKKFIKKIESPVGDKLKEFKRVYLITLEFDGEDINKIDKATLIRIAGAFLECCGKLVVVDGERILDKNEFLSISSKELDVFSELFIE